MTDTGQAQESMTGPDGKPSFRKIYRQQYREVSSSKSTRVFQWIRPIVLLAVAVLAVALGRGAHELLMIILGAVAVVLLVATIVLTLRQRRRE